MSKYFVDTVGTTISIPKNTLEEWLKDHPGYGDMEIEIEVELDDPYVMICGLSAEIVTEDE